VGTIYNLFEFVEEPIVKKIADPPEVPTYVSDFKHDSDIHLYEVLAGTWSYDATNEVYVCTLPGVASFDVSQLKGDFWRDFYFKVQYNLRVYRRAGVCFRITDIDNMYYVYQDAWNLTLFDRTGGVDNSLAVGAAASSGGPWYTLEIECKDEGTGTRVKVWRDGTLIINYLDDPRTHDRGHLGFMANNCTVWFAKPLAVPL